MRITLLALALVAVPPAFATDKNEGWSHGDLAVDFYPRGAGPGRIPSSAPSAREAPHTPAKRGSGRRRGASRRTT